MLAYQTYHTDEKAKRIFIDHHRVGQSNLTFISLLNMLEYDSIVRTYQLDEAWYEVITISQIKRSKVALLKPLCAKSKEKMVNHQQTVLVCELIRSIIGEVPIVVIQHDYQYLDFLKDFHLAMQTKSGKLWPMLQ